jgi:hypothetical protein
MYTFLLFYIQSGQYAPIVLLLHFFYAERERERERKKGWVGLIIPIILTFQICIINMNKRIINQYLKAITEVY